MRNVYSYANVYKYVFLLKNTFVQIQLIKRMMNEAGMYLYTQVNK